MLQKKKGSLGLGQLMIPVVSLGLLLLFNLIRDPSFYHIDIKINNYGNVMFGGNIVTVINDATELAIIAMGMTLVTAACGGQDISVGAVGAITGSVFVKVLMAFSSITIGTLLLAILLAILTGIAFKMFNGTLVAVFKIQPMIATLILYSSGRSIAYFITGSATPMLNSPIIKAIGTTIPGIPVPTSIFALLLVALILFLVFKFTNIRLYTQSVGINQGAARLNGINSTMIKLLSFVVLGVCVAIASVIQVCRLEQMAHLTLLVDIEMDAILAVAIGGNSLGGGKFSLVGSILGAFTIELLANTLQAMSVPSAFIKASKAIVIIIIVIASSPVVKERLTALVNRIRAGRARAAIRKEVG